MVRWSKTNRSAGDLRWRGHLGRSPYKNGVALIGDATASSDPAWGQGLSLTVRDVRTLRDHLLSHENWDEAGHAYAESHDRYYGVIHRVEN